MKKLILMALLIIATRESIGQTNGEWNYWSTNYNKPTVKLKYYKIQNKITVGFEFFNLKQLKYLPNIDSIIDIVKNDLQYLSDSLKEDAITRKLEYAVFGEQNRMRIIDYAYRPNSYIVHNKELKQLKTNRDTITIKLSVFDDDPLKTIDYKDYGIKMRNAIPKPVYIKFFLNNLKDILDLNTKLVGICVNDIKEKNKANIFTKEFPYLKKEWKSFGLKNYGFSILKDSSFKEEVQVDWNITRRNQKNYDAAFSFGFQNAKGAWLSSFNLGARLISTSLDKTETHWSLGLDNYFHFYNDANNHFNRDTYSFLTLRMFQKEEEQQKKKGFQFTPGYSFGYLLNRGGNLFEKNTMKMSFPFVSSGLLHIEPEIFFNDFFKNTNLSLKLSINYE
ncbi:MAG: hypothetical protein NTZ59_05575 [Bacteroidetes bacterium]|nr:hypothetical protein [Bacteroidota bacterium]